MINKIKVGFDIDGCMNNFHSEIGLLLKRDFNIILPLDEYDWSNYIIQVEPDIRNFWIKYNNEIEKNMPVEMCCKVVLKKLREIGCPINIITARDYKAAPITDYWLNKHQINYDNIYLNCGNKLDACKWLNVEYMVEDVPPNAMLLAENGIKVLLFEREYNKHLSHPNIIHCENWLTIYEILSNVIKTR